MLPSAVSTCACSWVKEVAKLGTSAAMDGERTGLAAGFRARAQVAVGLEWRVAWRALWTSRLVVWMAGIFAVLEIGRAPNTQGFDPAHLTEPFGYFGDLLV